MDRRWLVVFATASACAGQPRAPAAPGDRLGAIRIVGNRAIADDALEPALALHEAIGDGAAIDPYLLTLDTDRIRAAYVKRGFFAVSVTPAVERGAGGTQVVVFTVVEGRRAATRVEITGLPPELPLAAARRLVALADGAPFDYEAYDAARPALIDRLHDAGYARAGVDASVLADPAAVVATVRYAVDAGPLCRVGAIRVTGASGELEAAVRARLRFAPGDRYSARALTDSQAEIYLLGRFSTARVVPADGAGALAAAGTGAGTAAAASDVVDVVVELTPARLHEIHAGVGVGIEPYTYDGRVMAGGSVVPAAAPLVTLAVDARVAATIPHDVVPSQIEPKIRLLGSLQRMDLWWPRLRGEIEGGFDYQTVEAYTWNGEHLRLGLGSPLGPRWLQARIGWMIEELMFSGIAAELGDVGSAPRQALGLDGSRRVGAYEASLVADLRDDPIEPHTGLYLAIAASVGAAAAGGELSYTEVMPELRGYASLAGFVVAARARLGEIRGDGPVTERYYSGGTTGQRGFSERFLAPRVTGDPTGCDDGRSGAPSNTPIGGTGLIETGVELRRQLLALGGFPLGTNLFVDGAEVTCRPQELDLQQLQWAVGAGLWGKLGALKIHADLGYRLTDTALSAGPSGFGGGFAWHIGVGETY